MYATTPNTSAAHSPTPFPTRPTATHTRAQPAPNLGQPHNTHLPSPKTQFQRAHDPTVDLHQPPPPAALPNSEKGAPCPGPRSTLSGGEARAPNIGRKHHGYPFHPIFHLRCGNERWPPSVAHGVGRAGNWTLSSARGCQVGLRFASRVHQTRRARRDACIRRAIHSAH